MGVKCGHRRNLRILPAPGCRRSGVRLDAIMEQHLLDLEYFRAHVCQGQPENVIFKAHMHIFIKTARLLPKLFAEQSRYKYHVAQQQSFKAVRRKLPSSFF